MEHTRSTIVVRSTVIVVLCAAFIAQTHHASRASSITFDETHYLGAALRSVRDHRLDPRLVAVSGVAPVPIILAYLPALAREEGAERPNLWIGELGDSTKILGPRTLNAFIFGLPLIVAMFIAVERRRGVLAATLAAGLISASPTILAAGSLATTDLAFGTTAFLAVLATAAWYDHPATNRFIIWGAAIGLAIATKYSGVFLLPVSGLLLAWKEWQLAESRANRLSFRDFARLARTIAVKYLALLVVAAASCWLCHLLQTNGSLKAVAFEDTAPYSPWFKLLGRGPLARSIMTIAHEWIPKPTPLEGVFFQFQHTDMGHSAYLMGRFSQHGWWYFFPCAFAFKSTPAELLLALMLIGIAILSSFRLRQTLREADGLTLAASLSILIFSALMMRSPLNIGHRYILPVYPLVILLGVIQLARLLEKRARTFLILTTLLLSAQVASSRSVASDFLPYFNAFCGGPAYGRWLLVDSSLDWGQGLKRLKEFQDAHKEPLALKYFGTALPEDYGLRAINVDEIPAPRDPSTARWFAISATYLQGDYTEEVDPFRPLREFEPSHKAGESILIYDLQEPGRREALQESLKKLPDSNPSGFKRWTSWPGPWEE